MNDKTISPVERLAEPRTVVSFAVAIIVLYLLFSRLDLGKIFTVIWDANLIYILAAAALYFGSLPLRGERWRLLLGNIGVKAGLHDATEIFMLSWFANSLVPAKMGDLYRGYLAKKQWGVSISKGFGTVYVERIYDVLLLVIMMGGSSIMVFGRDVPPQISISLALGFSAVVILIASVVAFSSGKEFIAAKLPLKIRKIFILFAEGLKESAGKGSMKLIVLYTILIWIMEIGRLYFVVGSLSPLHSIGISLSAIVFVALAASLLSAFPATPGGLGPVEITIVSVFMLAGVDEGVAGAIAVLDRLVSYWGLVFLGALVYLYSNKK